MKKNKDEKISNNDKNFLVTHNDESIHRHAIDVLKGGRRKLTSLFQCRTLKKNAKNLHSSSISLTHI